MKNYFAYGINFLELTDHKKIEIDEIVHRSCSSDQSQECELSHKETCLSHRSSENN